MNLINSVGYENDLAYEKACAVANELNYILSKEALTCLFVTAENKLCLKKPSYSLLSADFNASTWSKRKSEGKKQGLIRAVKPVKGLKVIDATAGWGRDAAILASFGAEVLMLERNPVMKILLADALCSASSFQQPLQLSLKEADACTYLKNLDQPASYPDVIYIDPMHPERHKSALVKKEMQILQQLIGLDEDALELIKIACLRIKQRVVVKWPQKIPPLVPPTFSIAGKTVRFDIYLPIKIKVC